MRKAISAVLTFGILAASLAPAWATVTGSKKLSDGAQYTVDGSTLRIQFWSPEIARVTYAPGDALPTNKSLAVIASPASVSLKRQEDNQTFTLSSKALTVKVNKQTGAVSLLDPSGHLLLQESAQAAQ